MPSNEELKALIREPRESLNMELKRALDLTKKEDTSKLIKACLALRNRNGGHLLIGFHDDGSPNPAAIPSNAKDMFHTDEVQLILSRHSSEPFELEVRFVEHDGVGYPIIIIPSGVKTPVAVKANYPKENQAQNIPFLLVEHAVYFRSLNSNNIASTTLIRRQDWPDLMQICFDNREADIGRFIRRQLSNIDLPQFVEALRSLPELAPQSEIDINQATAFHLDSRERFLKRLQEEKLSMPPGYWEATFVISPPVQEYNANERFMNLIISANPRLTGDPPWTGPSYVKRADFTQSSCEFLHHPAARHPSGQLDFWRASPAGRFYHCRALEEDTEVFPVQPPEGQALDFSIAIFRAAEVLAIALSIGRSMVSEPINHTLSFVFTWTGLKDRKLGCWADPGRAPGLGGRQAIDDAVCCKLAVPLDSPNSTIAQYVQRVTAPLFAAFGGFELDPSVTEDLTRQVIERRFR